MNALEYVKKENNVLFGKKCNIVGLYKPDLNSKPLRLDNRRKKKEKILKKEW